MSRIHLRLKVGEAEFEAEGSEEAVKGLLDRFSASLGLAAKPAEAAPPAVERPDAARFPTLADEVVAALPRLVEKFPDGPTAKELGEFFGAEEWDIRKAMTGLDNARRATVMRRSDSRCLHLVPIGYKAPKELLTRKQADVLRVMLDHRHGDRVAITFRALSEQARTSQGGIVAVLDALVRKKRILLVSKGSGTTPNVHKILDDDLTAPLSQRHGTADEGVLA